MRSTLDRKQKKDTRLGNGNKMRTSKRQTELIVGWIQDKHEEIEAHWENQFLCLINESTTVGFYYCVVLFYYRSDISCYGKKYPVLELIKWINNNTGWNEMN